MTAPADTFPDVNRPGVGVVLVAPRYVGSADAQRAEVERVMAPYRGPSLPDGFLSVSAFVSTDDENVLTYAQWTSDDAYRAFVSGGGHGEPDEEMAEPVRYRLYRGNVLEPGSVPGLLVAPVFDVDGRDRQRRSADALVDGPLGKPFPGLISSHFHLSVDGTRVLNWAEWVDEEAHVRFGQSSLPHECLAAITMPGVRGIGGKRYVLAGSIVA
ncbi:putative monooxygenase [Actinoplanes missouriensis 431]|uniref:Putative monooxygenase n=1 Tax=Actinoplanes missouriensis (strain ATCC 14538 / DSM 43046 / CBS 188.64 / JCM 3121 / NBRC 102363 / NCIMB 12654 / NRRL B-3342 / UNCC 431) TaxID=512565 RepID=I0H4F3_ACTM4|nr:antibiotic biosynthesis monooxygenase [Actinoplanes missouriensis]BAL87890.1 putative monooxygenase [Actinoplanes missouriensis 431]